MSHTNRIIRDEPCPSCRSQGRDRTGNHLIVFENGNKFCNRCSYKEIVALNKNNKLENKNNMSALSLEEISQLPIAAIPDRGLSKEVCELYGIRQQFSTETGEPTHHYYPVRKKGNITGYKVRELPKRFYTVGDCKDADLFGQHLFGDGGKLLVVTEGELDAPSASEMFKSKGKNYRVVSLSNGANPSSIEKNLEWVSMFDNVVICLDQDDPGMDAADKIAGILPPGKTKIMRFSEKDANDMLLKGKSSEFLASLMNAASKRPDGIVSGKDTWDILQERPRPESFPYPEDWEEMNRMTYGIRLSELDTWTSGSGSGKTQMFRELQYHLLMNQKKQLGVIALEEPLADSVEALMSIHLNKRIHLPDVRGTVTEEEKYNAWLATVGTNRIHFYDHFGSVDDDSLISKIRYMANGLGCKYIFIDHLSIVVSEFASEGGERERIDTIMTRLKRLTQELNIWIGLIVHLRKTGPGGKSFEDGTMPSLDDLRGSGAIKQLSNSVYATARDQQAEDPEIRNTSQINVLKCRFSGRTGKADKLKFVDETGRMVKVEQFKITEPVEEKF